MDPHPLAQPRRNRQKSRGSSPGACPATPQLAPHPTSPAQGGKQHNLALDLEPGPKETTLNKKALCRLKQRSQVCSRGNIRLFSTTHPTMTKRSDSFFLAKMEKKMKNNVRQEALQHLAEIQTATPQKSSFAKLLVETKVTPTKEPSGSQPGQIQSWPKAYHTIGRFPQAGMRVFILQRAPGLTEEKLALWKLTDNNIVPHIFEFETGLDPAKPWPQGPCHEKEALHVVLNKWVTIPVDHQQAKQLCACCSGYGPDWSKKGVYQLLPEDADVKTHVKHARSGRSAIIPTHLRVNGQWGFESNWSAIQAKLVDTSGYGRVVTTFFPDAGTSDSEWAEFATREAKLCCKAPLEAELSTKASLAQLCQNLAAEAVYSTKPPLGASGSQPVPSTPPRSPIGAFFKSPHQQEATAPASPPCFDCLDFDGPDQLEAPAPAFASPLESPKAPAPLSPLELP